MIDSNALTPHSAKTLQLQAQPYDITASGFYFESFEEYCEKAAKVVNEHGGTVEEFQIQFIEGEVVDCELAQAIGLNQANLMRFFACIDAWDEEDKVRVALALGQCGYVFDDSTTPNDFDLDIYYVGSLRDLAEQFVEEGLFGEVPERLQFYIDYDAIARDLAVDYSEVELAGQRLVYRCG